jgi:hypothetical protein
LDEISKTQKLRQFQREKREQLEQQVEEISPTGGKRTLIQSASRGSISDKKMNPFAEQPHQEQSQEGMFAVPMM